MCLSAVTPTVCSQCTRIQAHSSFVNSLVLTITHFSVNIISVLWMRFRQDPGGWESMERIRIMMNEVISALSSAKWMVYKMHVNHHEFIRCQACSLLCPYAEPGILQRLPTDTEWQKSRWRWRMVEDRSLPFHISSQISSCILCFRRFSINCTNPVRSRNDSVRKEIEDYPRKL